jgi:hypothetical protein
LKKIHLEPEVIGKVGKKDKSVLNIRDTDIDRYVIRKSKIYKKIGLYKIKGYENKDKDTRKSSLS